MTKDEYNLMREMVENDMFLFISDRYRCRIVACTKKCKVRKLCDVAYGDFGYPKYSTEEMDEFKSKYPEYFV